MKIKSYNLFLESNSDLLDEETIKKVKKIFLDRLEGEVIDGMEVTEFYPDEYLFRKMLDNQFGFVEYPTHNQCEQLIVNVTFKNESILPYLKLIIDEVIELGLKPNFRKVSEDSRMGKSNNWRFHVMTNPMWGTSN